MKSLVYIISSFRNIDKVAMLHEVLRIRGHEVLDWTVLPHPSSLYCSPECYDAAMKSETAVKIFAFCMTACTTADVAIYLGPSGQDSAAQVMLASISGTPVIGIANKNERLGIMVYNSIGLWAEDADEAVEILSACDDKSTLLWKCRVCGCTWARACNPSRHWVGESLCSACAGPEGERM